MTDHIVRITLLNDQKENMGIDIQFDSFSDSMNGFLNAVQEISTPECYEQVLAQVERAIGSKARLQ